MITKRQSSVHICSICEEKLNNQNVSDLGLFSSGFPIEQFLICIESIIKHKYVIILNYLLI